MERKTFNVINFGCRATQADGAAIEQAFVNLDLHRSSSWEQSDIVVINTCTVTRAADVEARQMIRKVHRHNPMARIVVTGCFAQRAPEELARMEGVSCVVGNSHKDQLAPIVVGRYLRQPVLPILGSTPSAETGADIFCSSIFESRSLRVIADPSGGGRTRPVLKVQDGCSYRCSYCIIPSVRGDSRSLPSVEVIRQMRVLLAQGFKEVTLTGVHLGGYGRDLGDKGGLAGLVRQLLREERLERLRLSSIEPLEYHEELIGLIADSPKMAQHFHVPLQSGSDRILRLMRRPYLAEFYSSLITAMRRYAPDAAIGADVMVGFPTESEMDHDATLSLLKSSPLTYLHVFPYSDRTGTGSDQLEPKVPSEVAQRRSRELRALAARKNSEFRHRFIGKSLSVLTLDQVSEEGRVESISSNYLKTQLVQPASPNEIIEVRVNASTAEGLLAEPIRANQDAAIA